jgi:hypothetical protein
LIRVKETYFFESAFATRDHASLEETLFHEVFQSVALRDASVVARIIGSNLKHGCWNDFFV